MLLAKKRKKLKIIRVPFIDAYTGNVIRYRHILAIKIEGDFAINLQYRLDYNHRPVVADFNGFKRYCVTHIPSGTSVHRFDTRKDTYKFFDILKNTTFENDWKAGNGKLNFKWKNEVKHVLDDFLGIRKESWDGSKAV